MAIHRDIFLAALEFTSLSMLTWLAAAAVPWLVHRWFRRPQRIMPWAAVELLLTAVRQRSTRIHLQQWLLLAVRTAILVLVALAAAGPLWRQWALGAGGNARTHRIVVVDQSYSMSCEADNTRRLDRAKQRAREIIEAADRGDAYSVIGWSQTADNVLGRPTFEASLALAALEGLQPAQTSADLSAALRTAVAAIDRAADQMPQLAASDVVFLTDLGRTTWAVDPKVQALFETLAKRASLTVLDVGDPQRDNLAIVQLAVEPALLLRQRHVELVASVRGFGSREWSAVSVEMSVDGQRIESRPLDVTTGGETEVRFSHAFVDEGAHTVEVSLAGTADCLPLDDRRWLVVNVLPQLRVACFAATPGAADDVARALAPGRTTPGTEADSSIEPQVMPLSRLSQVDLTEYAAVLLCNVAELSPREAAQVERFVRQGGGLAVLLGRAVTGGGPLESLLPMQVLPSQAAGNYRFDPLDYGHPIVSPFRGRAAAGLLNVSVNRYVRLEPIAQHPHVETVLALDNGDPALVVDRLGLGRVAVMAIPCSLATRTAAGAPWSSFPVSPSFLPVV
ncbi:MAG: VWA domain-containing protein, partial [Planctomycetes bacterium]|nr:VWA domain-containing protein [Planctomycetota bacterium]